MTDIYSNWWKTPVDKNISKADMRYAMGSSMGDLVRVAENESASVDTPGKKFLEC